MKNSDTNGLKLDTYFDLHFHQICFLWNSFYGDMRKVKFIQQNLDKEFKVFYGMEPFS